MKLITVPIRFPKRLDLPAISVILNDTGLFPSEALDEMITPFLSGQTSDEQWFVYDGPKLGVAAFGYCRLEPFTSSTWNLLAIGVRSHLQGQGIGAALMKRIEQALSNERLLLVETSSLAEFAKARAFYVKCGYELVATIPGYWAKGEDKVIFSKRLSNV